MRLFFHLGASKLTFLSLTLLCLIPRTVTSYPHPPIALLAPGDGAELESALLRLRAALDDDWLVRPDGGVEWPRDLLLRPGDQEEEEEEKEEKEEGSWEEEALLRAQRGDLVGRPLSPFPGGLSLASMNYQEGGEGEDGRKRNEALTSIAGGLQAVSREKGGFGFRFGRKRWTDRGWMD
ncbi:uncharacterized protein qrfp [Anoplopoma fimbria]|uniref:uncharacterized protein qrfp n=1 Tax=Anoplopoma fimbria TaxID=229290 RepID=UPI0023EB0917|nr:uncharacterized protein qrfp [Anoplopoma fimbria]